MATLALEYFGLAADRDVLASRPWRTRLPSQPPIPATSTASEPIATPATPAIRGEIRDDPVVGVRTEGGSEGGSSLKLQCRRDPHRSAPTAPNCWVPSSARVARCSRSSSASPAANPDRRRTSGYQSSSSRRKLRNHEAKTPDSRAWKAISRTLNEGRCVSTYVGTSRDHRGAATQWAACSRSDSAMSCRIRAGCSSLMPAKRS